jgi:hypothetical protein
VNKGIFKGPWVAGMKHGRGIYTSGNISVEEVSVFAIQMEHYNYCCYFFEQVWDQGARIDRLPLTKFYPPRILRTVQGESGFVGKYSSGDLLFGSF